MFNNCPHERKALSVRRNAPMTVQADLVYQPTSGKYREKIFDIPKQDFTIRAWSWVLFTKSDGTEWVGSFHGGQGNKRFTAVFNDLPIVFIVSDGQGYIVNAETEELLQCTEEDTIREAISTSDTPLVIYANIWKIFTVDKSRVVKELEVPFKFYFVWFKKVSGNILEMKYEEGYTGELKKAYLNTKTLQFAETEKQSG
jgi:hypothetical protein